MFGFREQSRWLFGRSSQLGGAFMVSFSRRVEAGSVGARSARTWVRVGSTKRPVGWKKSLDSVFPRFVTQPSSVAQVSEWSRSRCNFLCDPFVNAHVDRTFLVPGAVPTAPSPSFASVKSHLRRPLDSYGHHRAACGRTGALGRRGFPLERAAARIHREGGARVVPNMLVRNKDLDVPVADA